MFIGESFVGDGANAAHINTVFGSRQGPVGAAWSTSLATPTIGFVRFVTVLQPNMPVKPMTLFVAKGAPAGDEHGVAIWGPAQAGVAAGVTDAVADGVIDPQFADSHVIIAAVWVDPATNDHDTVYLNNRVATFQTLESSLQQTDEIEKLVNARDNAWNPFYQAPHQR